MESFGGAKEVDMRRIEGINQNNTGSFYLTVY
jgi:hypothetical protein